MEEVQGKTRHRKYTREKVFRAVKNTRIDTMEDCRREAGKKTSKLWFSVTYPRNLWIAKKHRGKRMRGKMQIEREMRRLFASFQSVVRLSLRVHTLSAHVS